MQYIRTYRYRFAIMISLMMMVLSTQLQWIALAPVSRTVMEFYGYTSDMTLINHPDYLAMVYMGVFVILSLPLGMLIKKLGTVRTVRYAALLIIIGSLIKIISPRVYMTVVTAQFFFAIANTMLMTLLGEAVSDWFPLCERGFATGMITLMQYVAFILNFILNPILVDNGVVFLIRISSIISMVLTILPVILIREKPPTPSSYLVRQHRDYLTSMKTLMTNANFAKIAFIYSIGWGAFIAAILKIDIFNSITRTEINIMAIGVVLMIGGILGTGIIPAISDRLRKRKLIFNLINILLIPCFILMLLACFFDIPAVVFYIDTFIVGFLMMSANPIGLQYAVEVGKSIDIDEEATQAVINLTSRLVGLVIIVILISVSEIDYGIFLVILACTITTSLVGLTLKESELIQTEEERLQEMVSRENPHS